MAWICKKCDGNMVSKEIHIFDSPEETYFYEGHLECEDCSTKFDWNEK